VCISGGSSEAFTLATQPPAKGYGPTLEAKNVSREDYPRTAADVEHEITGRRKSNAGDNIRVIAEHDGWGSD
jgi:hypothetical protein